MLNHFRNGSFISLHKTIIWLGGVLPAIIPSIQVEVDVKPFQKWQFYLSSQDHNLAWRSLTCHNTFHSGLELMLNHFTNGSFIYLYKSMIWLGGVLPAIVPSIQVGVDVKPFWKWQIYLSLQDHNLAWRSLTCYSTFHFRLELMLNHFTNGSLISLHKTIIWRGGVLPAIVPSIQAGMVVRLQQSQHSSQKQNRFNLVDSCLLQYFPLRLEWLLYHLRSWESQHSLQEHFWFGGVTSDITPVEVGIVVRLTAVFSLMESFLV